MGNPRPYQLDVIGGVRQSYKEGFRAPCIVAPCGAGKTCIAAEIAKRTTDKGNRVLYLVHRKELRAQIYNEFYRWGVDMKRCDIHMVQGLARSPDKIKPPALIITDENHHSPAASYRKIYAAFPDARLLGVTATPVRLDGTGLGDVNDKLIESVTAKRLIDNGWLAPFDYYAPPVADLTGLHTSRGEFVIREAEERLNKKSIYGDVIRYYNELSQGRKAICYCVSVEHSKETARRFTAAGIPAEHIDGETPGIVRAAALSRLKAGQSRIICNVDLISEGFDAPDCGISILLRPTKSLTLYIQQAMRCMRPAPGKRALIIDHVGNYSRFGLPDAERKWSLESKKRTASEQNEVKTRQCPECYFIHKPAPVCPECGYVYPVMERSRNLDEIKEAKLEAIKGFVLDFSSPEDCKSMPELYAYAEKHNYKRGWAWYRGREMGLI
ncbi:MAG: DEAD/DEAH box helicase [Defluviitaleaceae bacterium]|nr:DEAD/DEAH box helicase [Defluviitaleaceae bacterium]